MEPRDGERAPRGGDLPGDGLAAVAIVIAIGVPAALLSFAIYRHLGAVAAPVLGPWAGLAVGHRDCTMGTQMPGVSVGAAVAGIAIAAALATGRPAARGIALVALGAWMLVWCGLALMSMLNARS